MSSNDRQQQILSAVMKALEETRRDHGGARLCPFTAAELAFLQDLMTRTLSTLLPEGAN